MPIQMTGCWDPGIRIARVAWPAPALHLNQNKSHLPTWGSYDISLLPRLRPSLVNKAIVLAGGITDLPCACSGKYLVWVCTMKWKWYKPSVDEKPLWLAPNKDGRLTKKVPRWGARCRLFSTRANQSIKSTREVATSRTHWPSRTSFFLLHRRPRNL